MNIGPDHRESPERARLDAEERELAARLARLGPIDGPPPALDARILAAAHAAAASRTPNRRRHWLAWMGVPPAMITGAGVAAAAVLALGLVWQLRPRVGVVPAQEEAAAGEEVFILAEPASPRPAAANPPPLPGEAFPDEAAPAPPASRMRAPAPPMQASVPQQPAAAPASSPAVPAEASAAAVASASPPPAPPSEAPAMQDAQAKAAADSGAAREAAMAADAASTEAEAERRQSRANYTTAARATAERASAERSLRQAAAPAPQAALEGDDAAALDRVEVTGSRQRVPPAMPEAPPPTAVSEDAGLPAAEWLERIRARRDAGDLDRARESLRLFRREHPRIRVPDDLSPLLADARQ